MPRTTLTWTLCALAIGAGGMPAVAAAPAGDNAVTVESLLGRMVDLRPLAEAPAPGERTVQFSSYDRATRLENGQIVQPFANGDRGHYLRAEGEGDRKEFVLAESDGPGYVSRIWSANPAGELRIYIDGAPTPALAADFARITNGEVAPFTAPFGYDASRGRNLYFPFPFARSIKITTTEGDQYYQVAVTTLPAGTAVESYSPAVLERAAGAIAATRKALRAGPAIAFENAAEVAPVDLVVEPGQVAELGFEGTSGRAIQGLRLRVESADLTDALARTLLTITFDGAREPQVAAPLGEFFGTGPGLNPYRSTVAAVEPDGTLTLRWFMPFQRSAVLRLRNQAEVPMKVNGAVALTPYTWTDRSLHFHARWRLAEGLSTVGGDGTGDWRALTGHGGPGRFVGLLLNVFNPTGAWWGEGDEKVYVDGEPFPSTFGTGTEDYFGYAWCDPTPYMKPFHAQTRCDGPANRGNTSNVRFQVIDAIPWHESLAFDMEIWHWKAVTIQYATLAFAYAAPGTTVDPGMTDLSNRIIHQADEGITREPGAIEGEALKVVSATAGRVQIQEMLNFGEAWSGGQQLWWVCREPGSMLTLSLPVEQGGTYDLSAAFTKAGDYGIAALSLDGKVLGEPLDLYAPRVKHTGPAPLGRVHLEAGTHELTVRLTGQNPQSTSTLFGLDWIKLEQVGK